MGDNRYCSCDNPASHYQGIRIEDEETQHNEDPATSELELYLTTLSMLLRSRI
jgi:hypothetical protein